jgi:hypothetical protein
MPHWIVPLLVLCSFVGFIGFALRQGTKVPRSGDDPGNDGDAASAGDGSDSGGHF